MHTQLNLFERNGDSRHTQTELFAGQPVVAHGLTCEQCGSELIETENYLTCPNRCGKLIPDVPDAERSGSWFTEDE